ncbi:MAG: L-aspartate oxidase, partial [Pseudomonadota bacterium]
DNEPETPEDSAAMKKLRETMSAEFGVLRTPDGMLEGLRTILDLEAANTRQRFENSLITAKMVAVSAIMRKESRGGHYRLDLPDENPALAQRSFLSLKQANILAQKLVAEPVAASA